MGIYPETDFKVDRKTGLLTKTYNDFSGVVVTTIYQPICTIEARDNCYCCSCGEREGSDPHCRNHGWAGQRSCELHEMPGSPNDEGNIPQSVQAERRYRDSYA
jgi:hypothetical protein